MRVFIYSLFFLIVTSSLEAKTLDVDYRVRFGIVGELGISHARLEDKGNSYTISIDAQATGMAKLMSKNRKEKHISKGFIHKGLYYSTMYSAMFEYGGKRNETLYKIDHRSKSVTKIKDKYKDGKLISHTEEKLDFFSTNDLLTLYFNLPKIFAEKQKAGLYRFKAVGAEKQEGTVELIIPTQKQLPEYKKTLGAGNYRYLTAIIYQKVFSSNKGELMLAIGEDGVTQKAVLKDLILFGDLVAERIR